MKPERSSNPHKFFSAHEKKKIVEAIKLAETQTSGEIRLHLEKRSRKPVMDRAVRVFNKLGMGKTALKNGVLIYLATASHEVVILGDRGINEAVPENFWNDIAGRMSQLFKEDKICDGLCEGTTMIGEKLKAHFPHLAADRDELANVPEAERKFLAGLGAQYESEMVYHSIQEHLEKQGVIFLSIEDGLKQYPDMFREYFGTVIPMIINLLP